MSRLEALGPPLLGALLRRPHVAVTTRIVEGLHAAGFTDVVPAHLPILRWPGPAGRRPSEIADDAGMTKQATNYLLGQLEDLGYLERRDDPEDRRSKRVHLTRRGTKLGHTIRLIVTDVETELSDQLGERDFTRLRTLLERLNETDLVDRASAVPTGL